MAADTSSIAIWLEQPHIILVLSRNKFSQYNKTLNTEVIVFVLLGNAVTQ